MGPSWKVKLVFFLVALAGVLVAAWWYVPYYPEGARALGKDGVDAAKERLD